MTLPFGVVVPKVKLTRERLLLLTMFATSVVSFFIRLPLRVDEYVLSQVPGSLPQSYIEILFKASILGIILTVIIEDYGRYGPSNEPNPNRVLPYGVELPVKSKILNLLMSLFRRPVDWLNGRMPILGKELMMSSISRSPSAFLTLVIVASVVTVPISAFGVFLVLTYGSGITVVPPGILAFLLGLIPVLVFVFGLNAPRLSKSGRAGALDHELPYIMGYFNILASGGISPVIALRKLAKVGRLFPAAAREARRILLDIDVFGKDPLSVYEKVGKLNPNKPFADFFAGYSTVIRSGGDTVSYIDSKMKDIFGMRSIRMRAYVETTGVLAEAYISLTVILGIVLFALFAVQSLSLGQGKSGLDTGAVQTSIVFSTVVIPVISAAFMFIIHLSQPREPTTFYSPYIVFAASTFAIPIMFLIPIPLELPIRVGLGLLISTIPPAVVAMRESAHKKGVESKLPSFLVDLTEVRKTGLPPERGIEQLAMRDYGAFSKYVQGMSAQLSWGVSLEKVMGNFTTSVRSWIARVTAFLLLEVTEVGGGTVKMFVALSEFSQKLQELEKERRSQLRLYLLLPYMGAIMIVATTGMLLGFIATPSFNLPGAPPLPKPSAGLSSVATTLFSGIIVESWAMGFVAGKMGEGNVAAGFKHAGILTAVTLGTVYLMKLFLPSL